jgi:hypothetical protein
MAPFSIYKICNPAKLYLVISAVFLAVAVFYNMSALTLIFKAAFIAIWTLLLNWLCSKGFGTLAWLIVILPYIFLFLTMFAAIDMTKLKEGVTPTEDQAEDCAVCIEDNHKDSQYKELCKEQCKKRKLRQVPDKN